MAYDLKPSKGYKWESHPLGFEAIYCPLFARKVIDYKKKHTNVRNYF